MDLNLSVSLRVRMGEFGAVQIPGHHPEEVNRGPAARRDGQQLAADSGMFTGWLQARAANDPRL